MQIALAPSFALANRLLYKSLPCAELERPASPAPLNWQWCNKPRARMSAEKLTKRGFYDSFGQAIAAANLEAVSISRIVVIKDPIELWMQNICQPQEQA